MEQILQEVDLIVTKKNLLRQKVFVTNVILKQNGPSSSSEYVNHSVFVVVVVLCVVLHVLF